MEILVEGKLNVVSMAPDMLLLLFFIMESEKIYFYFTAQFIATYDLKASENGNSLYPSKKVFIK